MRVPSALIMCVLLMPFVAMSAPTIWKTVGKSSYSDTPPQLRLHNVRTFHPRTGQLSATINQKVAARSAKQQPPLTTSVLPSTPPPQTTAWQPTINAAEQNRRINCQNAQTALQQAAAQGKNLITHEEAVVRYCITG